MQCLILQDFSNISTRYGKDVAKVSPPKVSRLRRPTFSVSSPFHHHRPSNQMPVHFLTAHRIGVQIVRSTKEPQGGHSPPNQEREKSLKIHSYSGKMATGEDTSVYPKKRRPVTALGPIVSCRPGRKWRSPCFSHLPVRSVEFCFQHSAR